MDALRLLDCLFVAALAGLWWYFAEVARHKQGDDSVGLLTHSALLLGAPPSEPGAAAPESVPVDDAWVDGPGGRVHALVSRPAGVVGPQPTVFLVHGGPTSQDADSFVPGVGAWVDAGFVVVRVNYRGSTGYGVKFSMK